MNISKSLEIDGVPCEFYFRPEDKWILPHKNVPRGSRLRIHKRTKGLLNWCQKASSRTSLGGWRSITLLKVSYKVLAKDIKEQPQE